MTENRRYYAPWARCTKCDAVSEFTVPVGTEIVGCTYDCECGRIMLVTHTVVAKTGVGVAFDAVDLYERMSDNLREKHGIDSSPDDWGYVEIDSTSS